VPVAGWIAGPLPTDTVRLAGTGGTGLGESVGLRNGPDNGGISPLVPGLAGAPGV
jgi:hypothetical protein